MWIAQGHLALILKQTGKYFTQRNKGCLFSRFLGFSFTDQIANAVLEFSSQCYNSTLLPNIRELMHVYW